MEGLAVRRSVRRGVGQLDAALAELGMLATVTDARRDYLQETRDFNSREKNTTASFHHLSSQPDNTWNPLNQEKMLRKIIRDEKRRLLKEQHLPQDQQTGPPQQKIASIPLGDYRAWDSDRTVPLLSLARREMDDFPQRIHRSASTSRTRHLFMPYDRGSCQLQHRPLTLYSMHSPNEPVVQRHITSSYIHRATGGHYLRPTTAVRSSCTSLVSPQIGLLQLPGQLPQNKSNPPSPVKSHPLLVGVEGGHGAPLVRSRSLDNIALCPLAATISEDTGFKFASDTFSSAETSPRISRVDTIVESVSSRIGSLQLTAN